MNEHYRGLGHLAVATADMDESIAFYEKIGGKLQQKAVLPSPDGDKRLALVEFGGFLLELIQSPGPVSLETGNLPHVAVYVDDLDAAAAAIRAAGVDTFQSPEKTVLPELFGGLQNWFFTGPSGEQIELLQML